MVVGIMSHCPCFSKHGIIQSGRSICGDKLITPHHSDHMSHWKLHDLVVGIMNHLIGVQGGMP